MTIFQPPQAAVSLRIEASQVDTCFHENGHKRKQTANGSGNKSGNTFPLCFREDSKNPFEVLRLGSGEQRTSDRASNARPIRELPSGSPCRSGSIYASEH